MICLLVLLPGKWIHRDAALLIPVVSVSLSWLECVFIAVIDEFAFIHTKNTHKIYRCRFGGQAQLIAHIDSARRGSPTIAFRDHGFERVFRIILRIRAQLMNLLGNMHPFYGDCQGQAGIWLKVKLFIALKLLCYGVPPPPNQLLMIARNISILLIHKTGNTIYDI